MENPDVEHLRRVYRPCSANNLTWKLRWLRGPLIGSTVGVSIVIAFLAIRGDGAINSSAPIAEMQHYGWNRLGDIHLLLVTLGATSTALVSGFIFDYIGVIKDGIRRIFRTLTILRISKKNFWLHKR